MADEITYSGGMLRLDMNADGQVTIADLPGWALHVFFLPGDTLIGITRTHAAPLAGFLELGADDHGGVLSATVSGLAWLAVLMLTVIVARAVHNFDQVLTARLSRGYTTARWRLRVGARLLAARLRPLLERGRRTGNAEVPAFSEDIVVDEAELHVLKLHARLEPGYALAAGEVAAALGLGRQRSGQILHRLVKLELLRTTVGGSEGETAYTLTRAGRAYLSFLQLS